MLTGIVLTKNESAHLATCLSSLNFCDHLLVIDDNSTDDTVKIAKKFGSQVITHPLTNFSAQRNFAISKVQTPWLLFIDADEVVSPQLAKAIKQAIQKIEYKGFYLPRVDFLWDHKLHYGDLFHARFLRLARRGAGEWTGQVHETWAIEGKTASLTNPIYHYPHQSLSDFLRHLNHYSSLKAKEFFAAGKRTHILEITLGPVYRFLYLYLFKLGFLDGTVGFIHAMLMAFYMFLVAGKLYLLSKGIA